MDEKDSQQKFIDGLMNETIRPHVQEIAEITVGGGVAMVVHNADTEWAEVLKKYWHWNGEPVFRMRTKDRKTFAARLKQMGDPATSEWLLRKPDTSRAARLFVIAYKGSLCVNVTEEGYSLEPGTTDVEQMASTV